MKLKLFLLAVITILVTYILFFHTTNETTLLENTVLEPEFHEVSSDYIFDIVGYTKEDFDYYDIGFTVYDTRNNQWSGYNDDYLYYAGSIIKVGIAMMIAEGIEDGIYSLDDSIKYTEDDYEEGTGYIYQNTIEESYQVEELVELMLTYSDNIATNMLIRYITRPVYEANMLKYTDDNFFMAENRMTARGGANLMYKLYINKDDNPYFNNISALLTQTVFSDRLASYIPANQIAHKIGSLYTNINDIAIIYSDDPVIVSVLCQNSEAVCNMVEADMGYELYTYFNE